MVVILSLLWIGELICLGYNKTHLAITVLGNPSSVDHICRFEAFSDLLYELFSNNV